MGFLGREPNAKRPLSRLDQAREYARKNGWAISAELDATVTMLYYPEAFSKTSQSGPGAIIVADDRMIVAHSEGLGFMTAPLTVKPTLRPDGHSWEVSMSDRTVIVDDVEQAAVDAIVRAVSNW